MTLPRNTKISNYNSNNRWRSCVRAEGPLPGSLVCGDRRCRDLLSIIQQQGELTSTRRGPGTEVFFGLGSCLSPDLSASLLFQGALMCVSDLYDCTLDAPWVLCASSCSPREQLGSNSGQCCWVLSILMFCAHYEPEDQVGVGGVWRLGCSQVFLPCWGGRGVSKYVKVFCLYSEQMEVIRGEGKNWVKILEMIFEQLWR